jgi:hypothetical protein
LLFNAFWQSLTKVALLPAGTATPVVFDRAFVASAADPASASGMAPAQARQTASRNRHEGPFSLGNRSAVGELAALGHAGMGANLCRSDDGVE